MDGFYDKNTLLIKKMIREAQKEKEMKVYDGHEGKDRVCCNCRHNIRHNAITSDNEYIATINNCDIDGHYIGYSQCFDNWCRHWSEEIEQGVLDEMTAEE